MTKGFAPMPIYEFVAIDRDGKLFSFDMPVAPLKNERQTDSRAMADAGLAFGVLINPDHPESLQNAVYGLSQAVDQAIEFVDRLANLAKANGFDQADFYLVVRLRRKGKWVRAASQGRTVIFEVMTTAAARESGRAVTRLADKDLLAIATQDKPRIKVEALL